MNISWTAVSCWKRTI